jgi:hypothetical protein
VELLCPLLDAGAGWLTLRFRCATGRANYFFITVVVIRYDTAATTHWTLVFIVRAFINYTVTVAVWTRFSFHGDPTLADLPLRFEISVNKPLRRCNGFELEF